MLGFAWRAALLGLLPLAAGWAAEALLLPAAHRLRRGRHWGSWDARAARGLLLLAAALAGALTLSYAWSILLALAVPLDLPWYLPDVPWLELAARSGPWWAVRLAGALLGAGAWFLCPRRKRRLLALAWAAAAALATALVLGWAAWWGHHTPRPDRFAAFAILAALLAWRLARSPANPPQTVVVPLAATGLLLAGTIGGVVLLLTGLANPGHGVRTLLERHAPWALRAVIGSQEAPVLSEEPTLASLCAPPESPSGASASLAGTARGADLLLVTVDSLPAARSSACGYGKSTTPVLALLAGEGISFQGALSSGSSTARGLPGILLSRPLECLGPVPSPAQDGLFARLSGAGYRTAAVLGYDLRGEETADVARAVLAGVDEVRMPDGVAGAGLPIAPVDSRVVETALQVVAAAPSDRPLALWVHFFDPHFPHVPDGTFPGFLEQGTQGRLDAEIRGTDGALGALLEGFERVRRRPPLTLVTADHGQSDGSDGRPGHHQGLYPSQLHVPFVLHGAGLPRRQVDAPVTTLDAAPTLLELLGVPAPPGFFGRSLLPTIDGAPGRPLRLWSAASSRSTDSPREWAVVDGSWWLVGHRRPEAREVYPADYVELFRWPSQDALVNLADDAPAVRECLLSLLPGGWGDAEACATGSSF